MMGNRASDRVTAGLVVVAGCALIFATMGRAVVLLAVLIQCAHLIEEYRAGFYRFLPAIMGSVAWSARHFLVFNLVWLAVFILAGIGLARAWRPAYLIALFLALGGG